MDATSATVAEAYQHATAALERGELDEARVAFEQLLERSGDPAIPFMLGRTLSEQGRTDEAIAYTLSAHQRSPTPDTLRNLAKLYWLRGDESAFESLLLGHVAHPELGFVAVELCRQSDSLNLALEMLAQMPEKMRNVLEFPLSAAWIYVELGDPVRALQCAELAYRASREFSGCLEAYASALLMNGRYADVRALCSQAIKQSADSTHANALLLVAERLLGVVSEDRLRSLIVPTHLDAPGGFADMSTFNKALRQSVEEFHCYQRHPVDQSLRGGSQTCRNLATCGLSTVHAYLEQCLEAAGAYIGSVEAYPSRHRGPVTPEIKSCWGVRLQPGGFHRSHIHPEGFLSAAYYLTTAKTADGDHGAIRFGIPPFRLPDELAPIAQISPTEGLLVLFPSYLWHGTVPTPVDGQTATVRETLPFDVTLADC
jgi:tetratricopeptide (TPR) repeat protein